MGKKYIIEVEKSAFKNLNGKTLWKIQGLNTCIVSSDLDKLEEYVEPVTHKFEVGDVCHMTFASREGKILITYISDTIVNYIWGDGKVSSTFRRTFEKCAKFIYHSDALEDFFGGE